MREFHKVSLILVALLSAGISSLATFAYSIEVSERKAYGPVAQPEKVPIVQSSALTSMLAFVALLGIGTLLIVTAVRAIESKAKFLSAWPLLFGLSLAQTCVAFLFLPDPLDLPLLLNAILVGTLIILRNAKTLSDPEPNRKDN